MDKANTAVDAAQAKIDAADKLAQTAARNKTDAEAAIKQANTDKTKAEAGLADAGLADAKAAKAEAEKAKQAAEAKKQKAEQARKQAAGVTNNGLASTGSDTAAIATLAAIMTLTGAGCVLVKVRAAKHADGWHVND